MAILGSNSMASNSTGAPSSKTILPRCKSPWQRAIRPASSRSDEQVPHARECGARCLCQRAHSLRRKKVRRRAQLGIVLRDDLGERIGEAGGLVDRRRRVRACYGPPERVGERAVDPLRVGEMIERLRLVEASHLHGPFHRLADAADRKRTVFFARDRHRAAVDCRRVGSIDLNLGGAGGTAPVERGIIEEREAHGALDLEGAVTRQKYRRGMGIDTLDRHAAVGCGGAKKVDRRLLRGFARVHFCPWVAATIDRTNNAGLIHINTPHGRMRPCWDK